MAQRNREFLGFINKRGVRCCRTGHTPVFLYNFFVPSFSIEIFAAPMTFSSPYSTFTMRRIEGMTCSFIDTPSD